MEIQGKIFKDGKFWLAEVPALEIMTQGRTKKDALTMIQDAILELISSYFPEESCNFNVSVNTYENDIIGVSCSNNNLMLAFSLKRLRETSRSTIREVAQRLGSNSPNVYAPYEKGRKKISLDQYERFRQAITPQQFYQLRVN